MGTLREGVTAPAMGGEVMGRDVRRRERAVGLHGGWGDDAGGEGELGAQGGAQGVPVRCGCPACDPGCGHGGGCEDAGAGVGLGDFFLAAGAGARAHFSSDALAGFLARGGRSLLPGSTASRRSGRPVVCCLDARRGKGQIGRQPLARQNHHGSARAAGDAGSRLYVQSWLML